MRLPIVAALTTAAAALLPSAATALKKEDRIRSDKISIFTKDLKGKQSEAANMLLQRYHSSREIRQREKKRRAAAGESAPVTEEAALDYKNLRSRRTSRKHVGAAVVDKSTSADDAAATTKKIEEAATKNWRRQARKERQDSKDELRAAAEKEGQRADAAPKDRRAMKKQQEQHKPNPRPPPSADPDRGGKPYRRRDLRDPGILNTTDDTDERKLKKSKINKFDDDDRLGGLDIKDATCIVYMTNLTPKQQFSDIFVMTHSDKMHPKLFEYGDPAFDDLAALAQDGDTDELLWYYSGPFGDDYVYWVSSEAGPIPAGQSIAFGIDASGSYDRLTLATSFIFSNDGFVAINGEEIVDGAVFWLWGNDAGVEANTQLCWTVQATQDDFPVISQCYDDKLADDNNNDIPGEGFVHVHSGIHDLGNKGNVQDLLYFTCDDLDANSFAEYFYLKGWDDDDLLARDDDQDFLDYLDGIDDDDRTYPIVELALDAGDFETFCDDLDDITDFLKNADSFIEPVLFDFRTPMMRVELECR